MLKVKKFVFNPFAENTIMIYAPNGETIIVDPGMSDPEEENQLMSFITDNNLNVKLLVNTHCHIDHILGNRFVVEKLGVQLSAHRNEELNIMLANQQADLFGLPRPETPPIQKYLEEGDEIRLDHHLLKVIYTPGHTNGGICLYAEESGFIICGDLIFRLGIGRVDLPGGDYDTIISSILNKIFILPDNTLIYSGHGDETTVGFEKKNNPFFR